MKSVLEKIRTGRIEWLPEFTDRVRLVDSMQVQSVMSHKATVPNEISFTEELLSRVRLDSCADLQSLNDTYVRMMGTTEGSDRWIAKELARNIEEGIRKYTRKGIDIYIHGEPEMLSERDDWGGCVVRMRQQVSFKQSDEYLVNFIDGITPEAVTKSIKSARAKADAKIEKIFAQAIKEFNRRMNEKGF